ncbi:MAG: chemotaxis protein CheW [Rhodospirillaceae bacterium]|nr:MAG: chemotaxis protein CheW [Rhodospirillaceae bacterium]
MNNSVSTAPEVQFVTLGIEREVFGVSVTSVLEILDMRPMFRLPEAPPYLAGLMDVRGRGVPVIDLRTKLGLPAVAATENTRVLVLNVRIGEKQVTLGLIADRVIEVIGLNTKDIEPAPEIGLRWKSDYISGIGRRNDGFVIIFDLPHLFSREEVMLIDSSQSKKVDMRETSAQGQTAA